MSFIKQCRIFYTFIFFFFWKPHEAIERQ
jgi:hypothetical protein